MRSRARLSLLPPLLVLAVARCQCEPPPDEGDLVDIKVLEDTRVLDAADRASLTSDEGGVLRFESPTARIEALAPLDVIVSTPTPVAPAGLIRLVIEVERDGDAVVARTVNAPIQLAFEHVHVRATRSTPSDLEPTHLTSTAASALTVPGGGGITFTLDEPLFNVDESDASTYDQVMAKGSLKGGLDYTFTIDFDWGDVAAGIDEVNQCLEDLLTGGWFSGVLEGDLPCNPKEILPEVKTGLDIVAGAHAEVALDGAAFLGYNKTYPLYHEVLDPIVLDPLVFVPHLDVTATFSGHAGSHFELSYTGDATLSTGIAYSTKHGLDFDPPDVDYDFTAGDVDAVLTAGSSASVGPELSVLLYDLMGPTGGLNVGVKLEANRDDTTCFHLYGTVGGHVGVFVGFKELPGFTLIDEKKPFNIAEEEFASGDCVPFPPEAEPGPHAGQPPLSAFQDPQFPPFAYAYPGTVDGYPVEWPGAEVEWSSLTPTIDGRFWLTGSDVEVLTSLDTDGSVVFAKRYTADVPYWQDLSSPKLLLSRAVPLLDATVMVIAHPYTLLKLTPSGDLVWARHFEREPYRETWLRFTDGIDDGAGGLYVVGNVGEDYANDELHDVWLMRLGGDGDILWSRRLRAPDGWNLTARSLARVDDDLLLVGDIFNVDGVRSRGLVARLSSDGDVTWATEIVADDCGQFEERMWLTSITPSYDGDFNIGGGISYSGHFGFVAKVHPEDGSMPWSNAFGTTELGHLGPMVTSLVQLPTTGFLAAGLYSGDDTRADMWLAGLDSAGAPMWARLYGGSANPADALYRDDTYPTIVLTQDGGAIVAGYTSTLTDAAFDSTWAFKAPARDGAIDFDVGPARSLEVTFAVDPACVDAGAISLTSEADPVAPLVPLTVFVQDVGLTPVSLGAVTP